MNTNQENKMVRLHDLLDYEILQFNAGEIQLKNAVKKWILIASALSLKSSLQEYLGTIESHLLYLKEYTLSTQLPAVPTSSRVMRAMITEAEEKIKKCADKELQDVCLLASVQAINHIKISQYGTAAAFSNELLNKKAASLFHLFEINEKKIDKKLSKLAKKEVNSRAIAPIAIENHHV